MNFLKIIDNLKSFKELEEILNYYNDKDLITFINFIIKAVNKTLKSNIDYNFLDYFKLKFKKYLYEDMFKRYFYDYFTKNIITKKGYFSIYLNKKIFLNFDKSLIIDNILKDIFKKFKGINYSNEDFKDKNIIKKVKENIYIDINSLKLFCPLKVLNIKRRYNLFKILEIILSKNFKIHKLQDNNLILISHYFWCIGIILKYLIDKDIYYNYIFILLKIYFDYIDKCSFIDNNNLSFHETKEFINNLDNYLFNNKNCCIKMFIEEFMKNFNKKCKKKIKPIKNLYIVEYLFKL